MSQFGADGLPGTMADGVEQTMSLDDNPVMEPLFPKKPLIDENADPGDVDVADGQEVGTKDEEAPKGNRKDALLARIGKLTRQKYEQQNENETLRSQIASLTSHVNKLQEQLVGSSPRAEKSALSFLPEKQDDQTSRGDENDLASIVRREVQEALRPITAERQEMSAQQALYAKHQAQMPALFEDYPELQKTDSDLQVAFSQIYDSSPELRRLENAPVIIAAMARGVVADAKRDEQNRAARKRAAGVHTVVPEHSDVPADERKLTGNVQKALQEARERLRNGIADQDDYKLVRQYGR
jgi:hypothetical protein